MPRSTHHSGMRTRASAHRLRRRLIRTLVHNFGLLIAVSKLPPVNDPDDLLSTAENIARHTCERDITVESVDDWRGYVVRIRTSNGIPSADGEPWEVRKWAAIMRAFDRDGFAVEMWDAGRVDAWVS